VPATTHDVVLHAGTVTKTFRLRHGDEADREWSALALLERHAPGLAPTPLKRDTRDGSPVVVMSQLPGAPLGAEPLTAAQTSGLARAIDRLHAAVPGDQLAALPVRRSGGAEMLDDLRAWVAEPAPPRAVPVAEALSAATRWLHSAEAASLTGPPVDLVFTQSDGNLANVLWDGTTCRIVDFEDSGVSDRAYEVADLLEHVSASLRGVVDHDALTAALDLSDAQRHRLVTARRMFATFWLLMLLPGNPGHSRNPPGSLEHQAERVQTLLRST
jgi:Ser/Thr protein kinase RdoA (MazF antagonist)